MYDKDGDFGRVRLTIPPRLPHLDDYFTSINICGWHQCNDKYRINRLCSDDTHLLFYTTSGMGELNMNGRTYNLPPDSVIIIKANTAATYYTPPNGMWEFYWIHFKGKQCNSLVNLISCQSEQIINMNGCDCVKSFIQKILIEKNNNNSASLIKNSDMLSHMLHEIVAHISLNNYSDNAYSLITKDAISFIHKNYGNYFELTDISKMLYISCEHLIRVFKKDIGISPHMYLSKLRIQKAKELLRQTQLSVNIISQIVGFKSHSNFSKQFKSTEGISPTEFRKSI